jgi:hypothetical protein
MALVVTNDVVEAFTLFVHCLISSLLHTLIALLYREERIEHRQELVVVVEPEFYSTVCISLLRAQLDDCRHEVVRLHIALMRRFFDRINVRAGSKHEEAVHYNPFEVVLLNLLQLCVVFICCGLFLR